HLLHDRAEADAADPDLGQAPARRRPDGERDRERDPRDDDRRDDDRGALRVRPGRGVTAIAAVRTTAVSVPFATDEVWAYGRRRGRWRPGGPSRWRPRRARASSAASRPCT